MKKRKRNLYFGFGPASEKERKRALTLYRRPKQTPISHGRQRQLDGSWKKKKALSGVRGEVFSALLNQGYKEPQAQQMAAAAKGADFSSLFRDAIKRNPRVFPAISESQIQALRKLVRQMAKKRKTRKKKNSRKGTMPAGLRKYWAKKRAKKNSRRRTKAKAKRTTRHAIRRRLVSMRVKNFRRAVRRPKPKARRRRRANPRRRSIKIIKTNLRKGTKAFAQFVRMQRAKYGKARVL